VTERVAPVHQLRPSVQALHDHCQRDGIARMLLHRALDEAPRDQVELHPYADIPQLMQHINWVLDQAPKYSHDDSMVGLPINAILVLTMGTPGQSVS